MALTKKIIEEIRQLSARDRRIVIKQLGQLKTNQSRGRNTRSAARRRRQERPYAALTDLAGVAHSDHTDISIEKYRHLASVYAAEDGAT